MPSHDLTEFNTLALDARAPEVVCYREPEQLPDITRRVARSKQTFVLGGGSNVVLAPELKSFVIKVESRGIQLFDETSEYRIVEANAGESWHAFVGYCVAQGWGGLENLALIPGTVGAAPVQNIGAYGVELDQRIHSVVAWDLTGGKRYEFGPDECDFSYRDSMFKQEAAGRWLILTVRFCLPKRWQPVLTYPDLQRHTGLQATQQDVSAQDVFDAVCEIRRRKLPDPKVLANAGSFFKNPVVDADRYRTLREQWPDLVAYPQAHDKWKLAAGWLIEQTGWKGRQLGPVGMHVNQALVLVNYGGATADDVNRLARRVRRDVRQCFGVDLEQEPVAVI